MRAQCNHRHNIKDHTGQTCKRRYHDSIQVLLTVGIQSDILAVFVGIPEIPHVDDDEQQQDGSQDSHPSCVPAGSVDAALVRIPPACGFPIPDGKGQRKGRVQQHGEVCQISSDFDGREMRQEVCVSVEGGSSLRFRKEQSQVAQQMNRQKQTQKQPTEGHYGLIRDR